MDAAERGLLETTVREAIQRAGLQGVAAVDDALAKLGWPGMLVAEPRESVEIVFRALGAAGATASPLDDVMAYALGTEPSADLAVVLPPFASWDAPGNTTSGYVSASGLATARTAAARRLLVACDAEGKLALAIVPAADVDVRPVRGLDPQSGFGLVRCKNVAAPLSALEPQAWDDAVALGRRAIAYEMAGACRAMLDLAREHALGRVQFNRPIARFQAVRHRLAESLVALETLDATLAAAADEPGPLTAALAKATAGRSAQTAAAHLQQVLAGIGFTTDHPFHRFLKRTMTLDGILGTADDVSFDVGRRILAERHVPVLVEL